jgi:transcription elongation factor Elf1
MTQDWIPMDRPSAAILEFKLEERRKKITQELLQQPDYPPLPECPECGAASDEIVDRRDLDDAVLIGFKPCGHRFRVEPPSLDSYL